MKRSEILKHIVLTICSSLIVIKILPFIHKIVDGIIYFFSLDQEGSQYVRDGSISFAGSIGFCLLAIISDCLKPTELSIDFLNEKDKPISELKFKKISPCDYESRYMKLNFMLKSPKIPLIIIKILGGRLKLSFNPNLINCELDDGYVDYFNESSFCYRFGTNVYIDLFSRYNSSQTTTSTAVPFMIQPLNQVNAEVKIEVVPKGFRNRTNFIWYCICQWLVNCCVKIEQKNIILKS